MTKGMVVVGRDLDGKARIIRTDNNGNVLVTNIDETIRDYEVNVSTTGWHYAGSVFVRGEENPLDVSRYKELALCVINKTGTSLENKPVRITMYDETDELLHRKTSSLTIPANGSIYLTHEDLPILKQLTTKLTYGVYLSQNESLKNCVVW